MKNVKLEAKYWTPSSTALVSHNGRRSGADGGRLLSLAGADVGQLRARDTCLLVRRVPEPRVPRRSEDNAQRRQRPEGAAPAEDRHRDRHDRQPEGGADARSDEEQALRAPAIGRRNPAVDRATGGRIDTRFGQAEEQSDRDEHRHRHHERRQAGEERPGDHDRGEEGARTEAIRGPARRHLAQRIAEREDAEDEAERDIANTQLRGHARLRRRDRDPVDDRQEREHEQEGDHARGARAWSSATRTDPVTRVPADIARARPASGPDAGDDRHRPRPRHRGGPASGTACR